MKNPKKNFLQKFTEKLRYGLLLQAINNRIAKIGIEIKPFYWTQEGITDIEPPTLKGNPADYSIRIPKLDDLLNLCNNATSSGYNMEIFRNYIKEGRKCFGVAYKNKIVSILWVSFRECRHKSFIMPLKENEVYYSDMYTMETFRGKNLAPFLRYHSMNELKKMGKDTFYSITDYFNTAAKKYKIKLKAKHLKLYVHVTLFRKYKRVFKLRTYK